MVPSAMRMTAEDRREVVLQAAAHAFARTGYTGTSTDAVAKEAGVSQPYVVRIFGTKRNLFLEVFARSGDRVARAFAEVIESPGFDPADEQDREQLGTAYTDLLADRDLLLVLLHGFAAGDDEAIGAVGRASMGRIFGLLCSAGMPEEEARDFIAFGMLLNVMMAIRAPDHVADGTGSGAEAVGDVAAARSLAAMTRSVFGEHLCQARVRTPPGTRGQSVGP